ncbi:transporter [Pedobacter jeongneungensis]
MKKSLMLSAFLLLSIFCSFGQEIPKYSIFNPVPRAMLRDMETDRPDVTESARTIDAGHFQYESDLFRLERQHGEEGIKESYFFNQANLKFGLLKSTALQFIVQSYQVDREVSEDGEKHLKHGFGDITLRIKQNMLGNDKGDFAIALLPYLKFPTSAADKESRYEGGLIIPMNLKLKHGWTIGMQLEADRLQDEQGIAHHTEFLQTLTLSHALARHLDAIGETYYTYDLKEKQWNNYLNAALQFELAKDVKIDGGLNYGLQEEAKKSYFLGVSFRL